MFSILFFIGLVGDARSDLQSVRESVLGLHSNFTTSGTRNLFWYECGKKLNRQESESRAEQYADAIMSSVEDVYRKTGELINPDHVVAILFRESSHDECVIGKKESDLLMKKLSEAKQSEHSGQSISYVALKKDDFSSYVKRWEREKIAAHKWCKWNHGPSDCVEKLIRNKSPEYSGIIAWDVGAAQFRYPGSRVVGRGVVLPTGKSIKRIMVSDLLDYDISIQMLVEDLAYYKKECRSHTHWVTSKKGINIRKLDVEDAYYVHHHTGKQSWSLRYWNAIRSHLSGIEKVKKRLLSMFFPFRIMM
jgi:hypothetical protein